MTSRTLGREGLTVSALGLGCMGMSQGYGPTDDAESIATVQRAIDLGVTFLDTAMSYGAGHNEQLLGRALAGRRDDVVLATKFGIVREPGGETRVDARPERVRADCEASLARLGVEHVDLYYLHRVDPDVPIDETVGAMGELVADGKVRYLGISEASSEQLERAVAVHPISALQTEWSLGWREIEDDVLPAARRLGIGVVAYSPLGRGLLTGAVSADAFGANDFRRRDPRFHGEHLRRNRALVDELRRLAAEHDATPAQLGLAWLLAQGQDVVAVPGTKRRERIEENAGAVDIELSVGDLSRLEELVPRRAWSGDRHSFATQTTRTRTVA